MSSLLLFEIISISFFMAQLYISTNNTFTRFVSLNFDLHLITIYAYKYTQYPNFSNSSVVFKEVMRNEKQN